MPLNPDLELAKLLTEWNGDPIKFVAGAFTWGSGELDKQTGPDVWQRQILEEIRDGRLDINQAVRIAVASGHGVGKSCLVAWIILWSLVTREDSRGVVTANTETQLRTKTWPELAKWHRLCIFKSWFVWTATAIYSADPDHAATWRVDAIPWSATNPAAFAGLHNAGKRILVVIDEASGVDDIIWEVTEGALTDTDTEIIWLVFGNPQRNEGRFRQCFGRYRHRWITHQIDSRTAKMSSNHKLHQQWVEDYGEDSDFVRVRVRGVFPRSGTQQFISSEMVEEAASEDYEAEHGFYDPRIMGVDVARFGDDQTIICFRVGRDARSFKPIKLRGADTMQVAARVVEEAEKFKADAIFVDGGGVGGGVVDRLRYLRQPVTEVNFGGKADRASATQEGTVVYFNKGAEMWGNMREWLEHGLIDNDPELISDLTGRQYGFSMKEGKDAIQLEKKDDMKKRGLASPDNADALCLTFAYPVVATDHAPVLETGSKYEYAYDPYSYSNEK